MFKEYLIENDYTVSGFSYGAQRAFEYVYEKAAVKHERIDRLQLFSPAFFMDKDEKYKRMQLMFFNKDRKGYCSNFLKNCASPKLVDLSPYFKDGTSGELKELLEYEWDKKRLKKLKSMNIDIEVYLGGQDLIIDSAKAKEFFVTYSTIYFFKEKGHLL